MAQANAHPQIDLEAGLAALEEDLPRVLRALDVASIEELGWTRPSKLTLLVPMAGEFQGKREDFLLKLGFQAYRSWPPSAQFVNPETQHYVQGQDRHHIPILTSSECRTHTEYGKPGGGSIQLICCSATLEFYDVLHSVQQEHLWRDTFTFLTTISAIEKAFRSSFEGRFPPHGQ